MAVVVVESRDGGPDTVRDGLSVEPFLSECLVDRVAAADLHYPSVLGETGPVVLIDARRERIWPTDRVGGGEFHLDGGEGWG